MIDRDVGPPLPPNLSSPKFFDKGLGGFIIGTLDFKFQPMTRFEQDTVWPDLYVELVDPIGFKEFSLGMEMNWMPRF
jgi:hypothetical protein